MKILGQKISSSSSVLVATMYPSAPIKAVLALLVLQLLLVEGVVGGTHDKKGVGHRNKLYKARLSEGEFNI